MFFGNFNRNLQKRKYLICITLYLNEILATLAADFWKICADMKDEDISDTTKYRTNTLYRSFKIDNHGRFMKQVNPNRSK